MSARFILALDPSGAFYEGKGTTGWCIADCNRTILEIGHISATDFESDFAYWKAHLDLIAFMQKKYPTLELVMEDYLLYAGKATSQINSRFETIQLIGVVRFACILNNLPVHIQMAVQVKERWANNILEAKGVIVKSGRGYRLGDQNIFVNRHELDSIRHAMHYVSFYNKE